MTTSDDDGVAGCVPRMPRLRELAGASQKVLDHSIEVCATSRAAGYRSRSGARPRWGRFPGAAKFVRAPIPVSADKLVLKQTEGVLPIMALPFPGMIEWQPAYSLDIASVDNQHRMLVSIIGHLQEAMLEGRTAHIVMPLFSAMRQYTKYHFEYEEQLLKENGYPDLESHHELHADLIATLQELENKYAEGSLSAGAPLMQFLRTWLLDHIGVHDRQYAAFLKEKGAS